MTVFQELFLYTIGRPTPFPSLLYSRKQKYFITQSHSATVYFFCTISSSSSFFCQHFSDLYLGHDLTDFNLTFVVVMSL